MSTITNTPNVTAPAPPTGAALREFEVAIHFDYPAIGMGADHPAFQIGAEYMATDRAAVIIYLSASLSLLLRRECILCGDMGSAGNLQAGLLRFTTTNRDAAIATAKELLKACFLLAPDFVEVAWLHSPEEHWVTVYPTTSTLPFDRWMTAERDAARLHVSTALKRALEELDANRPPENPS